MDFDLPADNDPRRTVVRDWIAANPKPSGRTLAEAGFMAPHWPKPYGVAADPITQLIIDDEFRAAKVRRPSNPIGIGWAGPTILHAGTPEQIERYLPPMLAGEEIWCQLFSEPDAGSDLASLQTRAVRDGDEYVINGQKIWTSGAQYSKFGILIARTDPTAMKHQGVSYFICPMDLPGMEIRPIRQATGHAEFNEVFFTDVRLPASMMVGEENRGWGLAKVTLANERVSLSDGGVLWGGGPTAFDVLDLIRREGGLTDPTMRQRAAAMYIEAELLRLIRLRTLTARLAGKQPGPEASVRKLFADEHGQRVMELTRDLTGAAGMLTTVGPMGTDAKLGDDTPGGADGGMTYWFSGYIFARALTIGGGTGEVQRNIIGERVLGLPGEPKPT